jgi:hypothetical protein
MNDSLGTDYLGAKQPQHGVERLRRGELGPLDITAATMANIGPAMSFYFGFGFLAYTAGIASPLTIIAAGIAIAFLGNTLSECAAVNGWIHIVHWQNFWSTSCRHYGVHDRCGLHRGHGVSHCNLWWFLPVLVAVL